MNADAPLSTLLSWTWIAFAIETDNAFEGAGTERVRQLFRFSLAMWTNGLRAIDDGGVTVDELRARTRARCNINGLERWGWIQAGPTLRPTRAGKFARRVWPDVVAEVEDRWVERFGTARISALRHALGTSHTDMPWSPPEIHPSDGFRTHFLDGPPVDEPEAPLAARLGQALTALTLEHERISNVSLPLSAVVLHALDPEPAATRDLPARTGISKPAVTMSLNWLTKHGFVATADRTARLTAKGRTARAEQCTADDAKLRAALVAILVQTDALAVGLTPPPGCWRREKPYLAQTQRVLTDPTGALPRHPFVLHRGGFPDGA